MLKVPSYLCDNGHVCLHSRNGISYTAILKHIVMRLITRCPVPKHRKLLEFKD